MNFGLKVKKTEKPETTPYSIYYPHSIPATSRTWSHEASDYIQVVSIDPAQKNYAIRVERRYKNGAITGLVFDKAVVVDKAETEDYTVINTYQRLTEFLNLYESFYTDCHYIIIERQLPDNYQATRIAQHTISYFSIKLHNSSLLPSIIEVAPQLKGKVLGAQKGINKNQLKSWAIEKGTELLQMRDDIFSLGVLKKFKNKQDDLCDTVCQVEALFITWGFEPTKKNPYSIDNSSLNSKPKLVLVQDSNSQYKWPSQTGNPKFNIIGK